MADITITIDDDFDFHEQKYLKALPGTFDASFFTDTTTGKFRFPAYNQHWRGLVKIRDTTNYPYKYFNGISKHEISDFTLDDFEASFEAPDFKIESFTDFLGRFPEASFDKGVTRKKLMFLFEYFQIYLEGRPDYPAHGHHFRVGELTAEIALGLVTEVDTTKNPALYWEYVTQAELRDLCVKHNIPRAGNKKLSMQRLWEHKIPLPYTVVKPATALRDVYQSFVDFYINDIRAQVDHLHPLYLSSIWRAVMGQSDDSGTWRRAEQMDSEPYWTDRLIPATKTISYGFE